MQSPTTQELLGYADFIGDKPEEREVFMQLNRSLLEDAFPEELVKIKKHYFLCHELRKDYRTAKQSVGLAAATDAIRYGEMPASGPGVNIEIYDNNGVQKADLHRVAVEHLLADKDALGIASLRDSCHAIGKLWAGGGKTSQELFEGTDVILNDPMDYDSEEDDDDNLEGRPLIPNGSRGVVSDVGFPGGFVEVLFVSNDSEVKAKLNRRNLFREQCRTVHTWQGGEHKHIVAVLEKSRLCDRRLIYTMATRAKEHLI